MKIARWVLVVVSVLVAVGSWWSFLRAAGPEGSAATAPRYHCPMHPQITSNEPGECPICGMALVPIDEARAAGTPSPTAADAGAALYQCPMHPQITSNLPNQSCPICGMKLAPVATGPKTVAPVTLTLDRVQAIGVRTAIATERETATVIRAPARVEAPEQNVAEVHVRTPGFVERMSVRETGIKVGAGQELFAVYSPEIWQAEAELVTAAGNERLVDAVRAKLELLGMSPKTVDKVIAEGKPIRAIPVFAPAGGWVTKKNVVLGSYITPDTTLYEIVDLSRVYVVGDVFAQDAGDVKAGSKAKLVVDGRPELETPGAIDLVYPRANVEARTVRVRMQTANAKMRLVPGQVGTLEIARAPVRVVTVPRDAVVDTGEHTYVFVVDADEHAMHLTPRAVVIGRSADDQIEVLSGLPAGARVVSGATFLVDSESRLRAALQETAK